MGGGPFAADVGKSAGFKLHAGVAVGAPCQTVRTDLMRQFRQGKAFVFMPRPDLAAKLGK